MDIKPVSLTAIHPVRTVASSTVQESSPQNGIHKTPVDTVKIKRKDYDVYADTSPWKAEFCPAKLVATDGEKVTLSGVRWGYDEVSDNTWQWEPKFRDTQIDTSKIKDVYLGMEPSLGGHSTLVFEFEDPIRSTDGELQDNRLVVSVEAYRHERQKYKFWEGHGKNYGLVYQLGSFSDRIQHTARRIGRPQELRKLDLNPEQKSKLLNNAIDESVKDRTGDYYHTTRDSCYSGAQKLVESVVDGGLKKWAIPGGVLLKPTMVWPPLSSLAFDNRGLLTDEPAQIYEPDPTLYPQNKGKETFYDPLVTKLSHKRPKVWKRALQAAGASLGLAAASGVGMGWVATLATVAASTATSGVLADHLRLSAGQEYIDPTPFYAADS